MTAAKGNDLHELKGIGLKHTEMLQSIGVDSMKGLIHRNPASLTNMSAERHGDVIGLLKKQVAGWIEEAKSGQNEASNTGHGSEVNTRDRNVESEGNTPPTTTSCVVSVSPGCRHFTAVI